MPARLIRLPPTLFDLVRALRKLMRTIAIDDSPIRHDLGRGVLFPLQECIWATAEWNRKENQSSRS
jgi:hypothetical protein